MADTVKSVKLGKHAGLGQGMTLTKAIRRVTVFVRDATGGMQAESYSKSRKYKKRTKLLRFPEKMARETTKAARTVLDTYLDRHGRSNEKRRDGWLRDYPTNIMRAQRKGLRTFKLRRLLGL